MNWVRLTNVFEVQNFLGIIGYYRRFVKNFSKIATPITQLMRKDVPFEWNRACEDCFLELKNQVVKIPILTIPSSIRGYTMTFLTKV